MGKLYVGAETQVPVYEDNVVRLTTSNWSTFVNDIYSYSQIYEWDNTNQKMMLGPDTGYHMYDVAFYLAYGQNGFDYNYIRVNYDMYKGSDTGSAGLYISVSDTTSPEYYVTTTGSGSFVIDPNTITNGTVWFVFGEPYNNATIIDSSWYVNFSIDFIQRTQTGTVTQELARKTKKFYVGVETETPTYETQTVTINNNNSSSYFTINHTSGGGFPWKSSNSRWQAGAGPSGTTNFTTTWTALHDYDSLKFNYRLSKSSNTSTSYYFRINYNGVQTVNATSSVTSASYTFNNVKQGDIFQFIFTKSSSNTSYYAYFTANCTATIQSGSVFAEVARLVKKLYVGVSGVARSVFGNNVNYYKKISNLSKGREALAATTVGDYALFGGGFYRSGSIVYSSYVDAYDSSLTAYSSNLSALATARYSLAATTIGDYALFAGGTASGSNSNAVDAYNSSLTKPSSPALLVSGREQLGATTVGDYAIFAGGFRNTSASYYVDTYTSSLTHTSSTLSSAIRQVSATTVGDYAIFADGYSGGSVFAYNSSLVLTSATSLSNYTRSHAAATAGNYALFAGGTSNVVDAYSSSLTKTTTTALSEGKNYPAATTLGDFALFAGGVAADPCYTVDSYDKSLTRRVITPLTYSRYNLAATTVDDYALFGGGEQYGTLGQYYMPYVEAYELN